MQQVLWEGDTPHGHYQVVDGLYDDRPARVLYSGDHQAAQSGVAKDDNPDLLFDYNQRLLELALGISPKTVLLIGGGVGTLPSALLATIPGVRVDVVEPDEGLIQLGYDFFDLPVDDRLRLFHIDGRAFLRSHASRYDMIIVDAFHHTAIPGDLKTLEAFAAYRKHLQRSGVLAVNIISGYHGSGAHILTHMHNAARQTFSTVAVFLAAKGYSLWLPQNFILTAQNVAAYDAKPLGDFTRGEPIIPPDADPNTVLHDEP